MASFYLKVAMFGARILRFLVDWTVYFFMVVVCFIAINLCNMGFGILVGLLASRHEKHPLIHTSIGVTAGIAWMVFCGTATVLSFQYRKGYDNWQNGGTFAKIVIPALIVSENINLSIEHKDGPFVAMLGLAMLSGILLSFVNCFGAAGYLLARWKQRNIVNPIPNPVDIQRQ